MLKRALNISALLFANILLLANTIVPHHHHENAGMCFFVHCRDSKEPHRHQSADLHDYNHNHEGNPFSDKCIVDDSYFHANSKKISDYPPVEYCDYEQTLYCCLTTNNIVVSLNFELYLPQLYSEFIVRSIGLRAPPLL